MSAVPKKKLCWNCEGNVSREIDNCPYCGVYLHVAESDEENFWEPSSKDSSDEIPAPLYSSHKEEKLEAAESLNSIDSVNIESEHKNEDQELQPTFGLWSHLKKDILPLLFLMAGSIFFLFGLTLFLFARHSTLVLQWDGDNWIYFLSFSLPFLYFGWKYLKEMNLSL